LSREAQSSRNFDTLHDIPCNRLSGAKRPYPKALLSHLQNNHFGKGVSITREKKVELQHVLFGLMTSESKKESVPCYSHIPHTYLSVIAKTVFAQYPCTNFRWRVSEAYLPCNCAPPICRSCMYLYHFIATFCSPSTLARIHDIGGSPPQADPTDNG